MRFLQQKFNIQNSMFKVIGSLSFIRKFTPVVVNLLALGNVKKSKLSFAFLSFFRKFTSIAVNLLSLDIKNKQVYFVLFSFIRKFAVYTI